MFHVQTTTCVFALIFLLLGFKKLTDTNSYCFNIMKEGMKENVILVFHVDCSK